MNFYLYLLTIYLHKNIIQKLITVNVVSIFYSEISCYFPGCTTQPLNLPRTQR